jgi:hypothetical protein
MTKHPIGTVFLDANVLYPAPVRDFLLSLAQQGLLIPKWTEEVQEEWVRNLLLKKPHLQRSELEKTITQMNKAFPDAQINGYEHLIALFTLPDPKDDHVAAGAKQGNCTSILTFNLKDFPAPVLAEFGITAIHPDVFLSELIQGFKENTLLAFFKQVNRLKNPTMTALEVIGYFKKSGLQKCGEILESWIATDKSEE